MNLLHSEVDHEFNIREIDYWLHKTRKSTVPGLDKVIYDALENLDPSVNSALFEILMKFEEQRRYRNRESCKNSSTLKAWKIPTKPGFLPPCEFNQLRRNAAREDHISPLTVVVRN